jgi:hypothetical protein
MEQSPIFWVGDALKNIDWWVARWHKTVCSLPTNAAGRDAFDQLSVNE